MPSAPFLPANTSPEKNGHRQDEEQVKLHCTVCKVWFPSAKVVCLLGMYGNAGVCVDVIREKQRDTMLCLEKRRLPQPGWRLGKTRPSQTMGAPAVSW